MDLVTLLVISAALACVLAVSMSFAMHAAAPGSGNSLQIWRWALSLNAAFWLLYLTDSSWAPWLMPHWLAVTLINGVSLAAVAGYVYAYRTFLGLPRHTAILCAIVLLGLTGNLLIVLTTDSYWMRLAFNLGANGLLMIWVATSLFQCREPGVQRAARLSMLVFLGGGLALFSRFLDMYSGVVTSVPPPPGQIISLLGFALVPCFATTGFLLMHAGRSAHRLEHLAATDPLTGALNRRSLERAGRRVLSSARRQQQPVSVLMIDADHFKNINDHYGHAAGDQALVSMMQTLRSSLRVEDVIGRIGGEEFVVVLPNTNARAALEVAERVRSAMQRQLIDPSQLPFSLTVSIGIACSRRALSNLEELIRHADACLYQAKAQGRNRVVCHVEDQPSAPGYQRTYQSSDDTAIEP